MLPFSATTLSIHFLKYRGVELRADRLCCIFLASVASTVNESHCDSTYRRVALGGHHSVSGVESFAHFVMLPVWLHDSHHTRTRGGIDVSSAVRSASSSMPHFGQATPVLELDLFDLS